MIQKLLLQRFKLRAFTIIEVAIAMAVLSILVAVAITAFGAFQRSSYDLYAQVNLNRVFTAQRSFFTGGHSEYTIGTLQRSPEGLVVVESSLPLTELNVNKVAVGVSDDGQSLGLAVLSNSGVCWFLGANAVGDYVTASRPLEDAHPLCTTIHALSIVPPH